MKLPMYAAMALLTWKLSPSGVELLSTTSSYIAYGSLVILFLLELKQTYAINGHLFKQAVPEIHQYKFKQVAVLNILYFATFVILTVGLTMIEEEEYLLASLLVPGLWGAPVITCLGWKEIKSVLTNCITK